MNKLELLNPETHKYLMDKDPKTWSRAYYQPGRCYDSVENDMCKSFNVVIVDAINKPIITMLEELRLYMMERLYNIKVRGQQWGNQICPEIRERINELKKHMRHFEVLASGLNQFQVRGTTEAFEVDLDRRTCSCRLWKLNGYGCVHSTTCISYLNRDVEAYVDVMFSTITYMKSYKYRIVVMNGNDMWPQTNYIPPLPLISRRIPGRPVTKRKKGALEKLTSHKVSKVGKKIKCSICKEPGHNKATCPTKGPNDVNTRKKKIDG
ncbi:uncharacterized protein LOC111917549 [Lactuca sativa]|uniref:uncharacterized protein LOC111917549 n=1 Tax=Lactuca sativa TaxID=4236 RepID=UPI000CD84932|nr:uncharacterized protein LOC111917549 [Lactuca sativa]